MSSIGFFLKGLFLFLKGLIFGLTCDKCGSRDLVDCSPTSERRTVFQCRACRRRNNDDNHYIFPK